MMADHLMVHHLLACDMGRKTGQYNAVGPTLPTAATAIALPHVSYWTVADGGRMGVVRWGSMDTLVALRITTSYCISLTLMILDIRTMPQGMMGGMMGWFDSSVFLMVSFAPGHLSPIITHALTAFLHQQAA